MNDREKKMLAGLGIVAFLGLNMILYSSYKTQKGELEGQKIKLGEEVKMRDLILQEGAEDWTRTRDWFIEHPVTASTQEDAQNKLFNEVKAAAERCKLIIDPSRPVSFQPPVEGAYSRVRISLGFSCTDTALFQWITQMNEPQKFRAVTQLSVEPNKDRSLLKVSANVEQWISPDIPSPENSTEEEKKDNVEKSPAPSAEK